MTTVNDAPTTFRGTTADLVWGAPYGDILVDLLEHVPDLMFPRSVETYRQMSNDPQLRGVLAGYTLPVRRAAWSIDPAGCHPAVAQLVADDLGLPLLGSDPVPSAARRRGVSWTEHLRLATPGHLTYGFYPFEKRFEIRDGQARLAELAERVPASIVDVMVNADGSLKGIRQSSMLSASELIPAESLVWYVHEKEGANWIGRSLLRPAYGAWLVKQEMIRVNAISKRRTGMGVPEVTAPAGSVPAQVTQAQQLASAVRVGETAGVGLPAGFQLRMRGIEGSVPDPLEFIRYLDQQMATMALAGVLDLGSTPNGSRALGDVFVDLLLYAVQAVGDAIADEATRDLAVPLVDYNFGEDEPAPRVVCGDVGAKREVTVDALAQLLSSGALSADPALEADVRRRYGLPERDTNAPAPAPAARPAPSAPPSNRHDNSALRRQLSDIEAAATTDFLMVQMSWSSELAKLVNGWGDITAAQIDEVVDQVETAVSANDQTMLTTMSVDTVKATARLSAAMVTVAADAESEQRSEAKRQGVTIPNGDVDESRLDAVAATTTALLATGMASYAARTALTAWGASSTAGDVGTVVRAKLEALTDASLRDGLGGALTVGQNAGRIAALKAGPAPEVLAASEINDESECDACAEIDGHIYDTVEEGESDYISGGYVGCLGGLRCRGILVAVYDASSVEKAA